MAASGITRVYPDLTEDLLLNLFHKGARAQWTSRDVDWSVPVQLTDRKRLALARLLTPVYFGEQTAMAGASSILPSVMAAGETTAQLYLASFIMDEARHFEALTKFYRTLGCDPLGVRDLPELLRYYHRLRQGDRVDWVWGILVTDIIGKHFYRGLGARPGGSDPVFGDLSARILRDESRHLAFAEHYLKRNFPTMKADRRRALIAMRDDLFHMLARMTERVRADIEAFDIEAEDFLGGVWNDIDNVGKRIGFEAQRRPEDRPPDQPATGMQPPGESAPLASSELVAGDGNVVAKCFGCLLSLICSRRLATT